MNTRSVKSSQVSSLSTSAGAAEGLIVPSFIGRRQGPNAPRCSHTDDAPGPPLNTKVTGRLAAGAPSSW